MIGIGGHVSDIMGTSRPELKRTNALCRGAVGQTGSGET